MKELTAGHYIDYLRLNRILEALEKWLYSAEIIALVAQEFPASYHFVLTSATTGRWENCKDLWNRSNLCSLRSLRFWGARSLEIGSGWSRENGEWSIKKRLVYPVLNPSRLRLSFSRFPRTKLQSTHKTGRSKVSICNLQTPLWRVWELKKFQVLCTWNKCRFSYR